MDKECCSGKGREDGKVHLVAKRTGCPEVRTDVKQGGIRRETGGSLADTDKCTNVCTQGHMRNKQRKVADPTQP